MSSPEGASALESFGGGRDLATPAIPVTGLVPVHSRVPADARSPYIPFARLDPARDRVLGVLERQAGAYPNLAPVSSSSWEGLDERDAAFAAGVYDAVVRRWLTLRWVIETHAGRGFESLDPTAQAAVLAGAAQMFFMDRVPAYAAIDRSVEWAKSRGRAGGLVNAVLRKVARTRERCRTEPGAWSGERDALPLTDGRVLRLPGAFEGDERAWLGVATSHPRALIERWRARFGDATTLRLALHGLVLPPVIVHVSTAGFAAGERDGLKLTEHESPRHLIAEGPREALERFLDRHPGVWVQDPGSSEAVEAARGMPARLIVDVCAGRGTKTRQLAALFPGAEVLATDVDANRRSALARVAATWSRVRVVEPGEVAGLARGRADLVLLDVPCSNTGTLARRVEARYRFDGDGGSGQLSRLGRIQGDLIASASEWLAADGVILYSTCSLEAEENEERASAASRDLGLTMDGSALTLPEGLPGDEPRRYRDGGYRCFLRKARGGRRG